MTDKEALALKPGEMIEAHVSGGWRWFVVHSVHRREHRRHYEYAVEVVGRRLGNTGAGASYPKVTKYPGSLRPARKKPDGMTANVYADYLDEVDEPSAAAKLRKAFPLDGGAGVTQRRIPDEVA